MYVDFMGVPLEVRILRSRSNRTSYYDPNGNVVHLFAGSASAALRKITKRSKKWLLGHELTHCFLELHGRHVRRDLARVFGSLSEETYSANPLKEMRGVFFGFDEHEFLTTRAALSPEEDLAETGAFLYTCCSPSGKSDRIQCKVLALEAAITKVSNIVQRERRPGKMR